LKVIAFKNINPNFYKKEIKEIEPNLRQRKFRSIWIKKRLLDLATKLGLLPGQVLSTVVFKQIPTSDEFEYLKESGYKIVNIPDNPYR
jgi:hypothetical protein